MIWLFFVSLTIITWGSYNLLLKIAGTYISQSWALFFIGLVQVIVGALFILYQRTTDQVLLTTKGAFIAGGAGLLFALGTLFFLYAFKFNAPASIAIATYTVGALLIGVLGGLLFFNEALSVRMVVGITFAIASIVLLTLK
ncbi:hypothetical protein A3D62_01420 [Candidatus Kaiserbacteria bacterium RIFCSPHIGHO2_02_FULL_49_11]|uniref:EamA domain-containing protein n=1 Tax=Candidatus Kaiserbacteria bacterium RIFCSPHIGHO2_02_FULL_49_11 TaxID=1798489 RepID=A0A1F6D1C6_9BACT|nr:MAG: hypothetical protein A3D62_01420 [Candidatus Kaiserbacteria bacterium RIFCSPHIGHO2_02_FULL_49_11]